MAAGGGLDGPLTAEPEVVTHTLAPEDEFLLLGCDGLWDVLSSQRAVDIARSRLRIHNDPSACSGELVGCAVLPEGTLTVGFRHGYGSHLVEYSAAATHHTPGWPVCRPPSPTPGSIIQALSMIQPHFR